MNGTIPRQVYVPFLRRTIAVHWQYHAALMVSVWFLLVPLALIVIRFCKPRPTRFGIEKGTGRFDQRLIWWTLHYSILYIAIGLALGGMAVAIFASGGISHSVHALLGFATISFGCLQIVSAWLRGSHGGKYGAHSDPDDPATWHGDHYDMTPRRRWFEAYHKTAGYLAVALAVGAVGSGLMQYWVPEIAWCFGVLLLGWLLVSVLLEGRGRRQDTYRSVYGNDPDHPYNSARRDR